MKYLSELNLFPGSRLGEKTYFLESVEISTDHVLALKTGFGKIQSVRSSISL